jgi:RNA polymerase sigma factor (sigma-70 family)
MNIPINTPDLAKAIVSTDPHERNRAFKALYMSPVVQGKIRDWANVYQLREKTTDDVLQEGMILLDEIIRSGRFRAESRVETFLLGICKNLIRDSGKKVQRVVFKDTLPENALLSADALADHLILLEQNDAEQHRDNALHGAIGQLTEKCRETLRLYYFEQKTMAEVAKLRDLANPDQAKKAVFRCRESLRDLIRNDPRLRQVLAA